MKKRLSFLVYTKLSFMYPLLNFLKRKKFYKKYGNSSSESIFKEIYKTNYWGSEESRSGLGSELIQTKIIREKLPILFRELKITSILDIPCGDFNWLKNVELDFLSYIGADIVDDVIQKNNERYTNNSRKFLKLDILNDKLPKVDLILCRDLFIHLSLDDILKSLRSIKKSNSTFVLTTSYPSIKKNQDILSGQWHPVNLLIPPFSLPKPLRSIDEKNTEKGVPNKHLLLWRISDL